MSAFWTACSPVTVAIGLVATKSRRWMREPVTTTSSSPTASAGVGAGAGASCASAWLERIAALALASKATFRDRSSSDVDTEYPQKKRFK